MKLFLLRIFKGTVLVIFFYFLCLFLILVFKQEKKVFNLKDKTGGWGHTLQRLEDAKKTKNIDVLITGSSHAYRGYDTRIFNEQGYSTFNLGTSAQTMYNTYFLLEEYLDQLNPKLLILDCYWKMMENTGDESTIDLVCNSKPTLNVFKMVFESKDPTVINTLCYSYLKRLIDPDYFMQRKVEKNTYIEGGYVTSSYEALPKEPQKKVIQITSTSTNNVQNVQYKYLAKIFSLCKRKGVKVILVSAPVTQGLFESAENYDTYYSMIQQLAKKYNTEYYDYNLSNRFTYQDFYDEDHLVQSGVNKFNELLINEVINKKFTYLKNK